MGWERKLQGANWPAGSYWQIHSWERIGLRGLVNRVFARWPMCRCPVHKTGSLTNRTTTKSTLTCFHSIKTLLESISVSCGVRTAKADALITHTRYFVYVYLVSSVPVFAYPLYSVLPRNLHLSQTLQSAMTRFCLVLCLEVRQRHQQE